MSMTFWSTSEAFNINARTRGFTRLSFLLRGVLACRQRSSNSFSSSTNFYTKTHAAPVALAVRAFE